VGQEGSQSRKSMVTLASAMARIVLWMGADRYGRAPFTALERGKGAEDRDGLAMFEEHCSASPEFAIAVPDSSEL